MKRLLFSLLMLLVASSAYAAKKPCHCRHARQTTHQRSTTAAQPCTTVVVAPTPAPAPQANGGQAGGLYGALVDGFRITGGFRWDRACPETRCSSGRPPLNHPNNVDPFFVGLEERLPINSALELGGNFDRDFTDAPHWNARIYLAAHPWRR